MKIRNVLLALKDQLPLTRLLRNFCKGSLAGLFHERSHLRDDGTPKVTYNSKASAERASQNMMKKRGGHFANYKCVHCDGFHIGKSRPIE